jgi:hypothetical protein
MSFFVACSKRLTFLPQPIDLEGYEVSVADCYLPTSWILHYTKLFVTVISTEQTSAVEKHIQIDFHDPSVFAIVRSLTELLKEYGTVEFSQTGRITITPKDKLAIGLSKSLAGTLGFDPFSTITKATTSSRPVFLRQLSERLVITSNTAECHLNDDTFLSAIYQGSPVNQPSYLLFHPTVPYIVSYISLRFYNQFLEELEIPDGIFSVLLKFQQRSP